MQVRFVGLLKLFWRNIGLDLLYRGCMGYYVILAPKYISAFPDPLPASDTKCYGIPDLMVFPPIRTGP